MQIRVLGCHGADQVVSGTAGLIRHESCGFLIDGSVLLDAGTIGTRLTLAEQRGIRVVLLSHLHFDHIKGLPTLLDNLVEDFAESITVAATEPVLRGLKDHIFNNHVYPDFFHLPNPHRPVLRARVLQPGKAMDVGDLEIIPVQVNHTVPTVGYIVKDQHSAFVYSGDTAQTEEIWSLAAMTPNLKAAFVECSFPDELAQLADRTKHLTPTLFFEEWKKLQSDHLPTYAYHLKPPFRERILSELNALQMANLQVLEEGRILTL